MPTENFRKGRQLISGIIYSFRPNTWLRIWGEMIVAAVLASYPSFDFWTFLKGFIATSPLLWSAAYMINDLSDINFDKQHFFRKTRPISRGVISKNIAITTIIVLIVASLALGYSISTSFFVILILLFLNQILYTLPPIRLKEQPFWDITNNSLNSLIRFILGWLTQISRHAFPIFPLLFFISIKVIFFLGHRMQNRDLEIKNHIRSTITTLSVKQLYIVTAILFILSGLFYIFSILYGNFPPVSVLILSLCGLGVIAYGKMIPSLLAKEEENLNFRNYLYLIYFLFMNLLAVSILFTNK